MSPFLYYSSLCFSPLYCSLFLVMVRPPFFPLLSLSPFVCALPHLHHLPTPSNLVCLPSAASAPTPRCTRAPVLCPCSAYPFPTIKPPSTLSPHQHVLSL